MFVAAVGLTPLKGARHAVEDAVVLAESGPVGDREFCLVEVETGAVLRTIAHPRLLAVRAGWDGVRLSVTLPGRPAIIAAPDPAGVPFVGDYWGRSAELCLVDGHWADALGGYLGRPVAVARIVRPGEVVFGASVSVVTTSTLRALAERVGGPVDPRRFRATMVIDTDAAPAFAEDAWVGRRVAVGGSEIELVSGIRRCGVIDLDPDSGRRDLPLLRALTDWGHLTFGVDAVVKRPGLVTAGASVTVLK